MAHEELLASTDFFADASPEVIATIAAAGTDRQLVRGDVLFKEGDDADALYIVTKGRLAIAIANPIDHRETVVSLMEPGDLFGEMAMLDDGPRSAMARSNPRVWSASRMARCSKCSVHNRRCSGVSPVCSPSVSG